MTVKYFMIKHRSILSAFDKGAEEDIIFTEEDIEQKVYLCLSDIPDEFKNEEICHEAVKHDITMFFCVPDKYRTEKICIEVINNSGWVFKELLKKYLDDAQFINVIRNVVSKFKSPPLELLRFIDRTGLTELIRQEPCKTGAIILSCIEPYKAALILKRLPNNIQAELIRCIAAINIAQIQSGEAGLSELVRLKQKLYFPGYDDLVQFFMLAERASEEQIIEALKIEAPETAKDINKHILLFEEITLLSARCIQKLLREVNSQELAKALKTAPSEFQEKIFSNMSKRAAGMLWEDIEYMGLVTLKDIKKSQQNILSIIRRLTDNGEIIFNRPAETAWKSKSYSMNAFCKELVTGGIDSVIKILNFLDRNTEDNIMNTLKEEIPALAEKIIKRIFIFEDIVLMHDRDVQKVMREIDSLELEIALTSAAPEVKDKVFMNMSEQAASLIKKEMDNMGPVSQKAVEEARMKILSIKRNFEKNGEISVEPWIE